MHKGNAVTSHAAPESEVTFQVHPVRLLDERQAADLLGVSVALMRKMRRHGNGPVVTHIGRLVRYCEADVVAFVNANRVTAA